jgi:two-component system OmpR family response regulator
MRLLVVEDDAKLLAALQRGLSGEGYEVDVAGTGDEALARGGFDSYDAVLLDVMMPGTDGFSVCRALRDSECDVPVLMLTARTEVNDRIRGLDAGADDYLIKPFDFGELLARLRALIRRKPAERGGVIDVGLLRIDPESRIVAGAGGEVELTVRELAVLELLARNVGEVVSRAQLLDDVWQEDFDGSPNVVDVYVGYLRRKLDPVAGKRAIRTIRGVGFLLEPE